jgi:hypothetical protein
MKIKSDNIFNLVTDRENKIDYKKIVINLEKLVDRQMLINQHFPNPNRDSKFINVFDNMAGQIIEEAYETEEAISLTSSWRRPMDITVLEEFIDMFMYTGSLLCETFLYYDIDYIKWFRDEKANLLIIDDKYLDNINNYLAEDSFSKVPLDFIPAIRRKIYDRKYHKPAEEKPENYESELLTYMIYYMYYPKKGLKRGSGLCVEKYMLPEYCSNLNEFLQKILFCYDIHNDDERLKTIKERVFLLNNIIDKKENFITNL